MNILNRLKSIYYDSSQVSELQQLIPDSHIIANLRCGKWYCPERDVDTCYFKSTDGHNGLWDFNTRRLNMNVLELAISGKQVIIVDATANSRKVYPDALSKTVPIWITVFNILLKKLANVNIDTPIRLPRTVHNVEQANLLDHIAKKLDDWVLRLEDTLDKDIMLKLVKTLDIYGFRQIIPVFVSSVDTFNPEYYNSLKEIGTPIILLSVGNSDRVFIENQEDRCFTYILGAGDDEEMWSIKITPEQFWDDYKRFLLCRDDIEVKDIIMSRRNITHRSLNLFENSVVFSNRTDDETDVVSIEVYTDSATFYKNIGRYNLQKYRIDGLLHSLLNTIIKTRRYHITKIRFICNDFKISLALLVSIFVKFKNSIFTSPLILNNNDEISKTYIRKIISYIHQYTGEFQLTRNSCQELNKYFIDRLAPEIV
jgi:hypothetical protein